MGKVGITAAHVAIAIIVLVAAVILTERSIEQPLRDINATSAAMQAKL